MTLGCHGTIVKDIINIQNLRLVVGWNVVGSLTEKDANCGNNLINNILIVVLIYITCLPQMLFCNGLFYCQFYPSLPAMLCLLHTLCLSAVLLSSLFLPFDKKTWHPFSGYHWSQSTDSIHIIVSFRGCAQY